MMSNVLLFSSLWDLRKAIRLFKVVFSYPSARLPWLRLQLAGAEPISAFLHSIFAHNIQCDSKKRMQQFLTFASNFSKKPVLIFPKLIQTLKGNRDYIFKSQSYDSAHEIHKLFLIYSNYPVRCSLLYSVLSFKYSKVSLTQYFYLHFLCCPKELQDW